MFSPMPKIAVLVPCFNEALAISTVVDDFKNKLPSAEIFVYDNTSTDNTAELASKSGAVVRFVKKRGKGNVVRLMFSEIEAHIYVLIDGDNTYCVDDVVPMIKKFVENRADMLVGTRISQSTTAFRPGHLFGNWALTKTVNVLFNANATDMLSGYRLFSRRFVKSFPARASGFDLETELTVHSLNLKLPIYEYETKYVDRPVGSNSKLSTFRDGIVILLTILRLFLSERPMVLFAILGVIALSASLYLAFPLLETFINTGQVPRVPTAVLSAALALLSFLLICCGVILNAICELQREAKYILFLNSSGK